MKKVSPKESSRTKKKQEYKKPKKVLLLGSGALRIGQAGEFDYSGSQALKALKEEGIKSVLINPNIASIQTDEGFADRVYFLPVNTYFVEKIIQKEKIDAILLSFGGQTALNCGLELEEKGILKKYKVRVLGTPVKTIRLTEDRHLFAEALKKIGVKTAISKAVYSVSDAVEAAIKIGFPVMMRSGFSLGGKGSAIVNNVKECRTLAEMSFASVTQILVEECLFGWKEIEYEVVRDGNDNCITVCNMENFDPMGIHTGESIVVAPSQTLDDYEYQMLRDVAIKTIRHLGIVGECNIQYALDPKSREYRVIEVNARLSRSSALASKATGYPLAYVAAKIALGYEMAEIPNAITKVTTSFFEPALDYIVCKFPRWDLAKFDNVDQTLGTEMKSVGEVMAIGRSFAEVIQKAIRMLEIGTAGLDPNAYRFVNLEEAVKTPTPKRIFAIAQAMVEGMSVDKIHELTKIDKFFLYEIECIVKIKKEIKAGKFTGLPAGKVREIKKAGFADRFIAKITGEPESDIRAYRQKLGIRPHLSQIDTMAAEYPAETNFLYFTYANDKSDIVPSTRKKVIVLGSGCYRIGASVEFDWCAVSSVKAAQQLGYEVIMLNYNPETVSTDYDNCEQLVFDEIHLENVVELYEFEKPEGVIVSMGGQTPNNLALKLHKEGVKILGTSAESIDQAEDRNKFSAHLDHIKVDQPKWAEASSTEDTLEMVKRLGGFPVLVRPSYVLSGAAMRVADSPEELNVFLSNAADISPEHPVTISKFEGHSREIEFDAVAYKGEVKLFAITEHIENAGVHSGDATLVIPPQWITSEIMSKVRSIGELLAKELNITGPFNVQMLSREHSVKVIECNLRASRSFPYISKSLGINFITEATSLMLAGKTTKNFNKERMNELKYVVVKSSQFSFSRLKGADPRLGVEMASTGEVACFGRDRSEALLASMIASGFKVPKKGAFISLEQEGDRPGFSSAASILIMNGLKLYATPETAEVFKKLGVECKAVSIADMIKEGNQEPLIEFLKSGKVDMIISVPGPGRVYTSQEGYFLRRLAVDLEISLLTDLRLTKAAIQALSSHEEQDIAVKSWQEYQKEHALVQ